MPLNEKGTQVAMKVEATPGTPETLAAADAGIKIYEASFQPDIEQHDRRAYGGGIGRTPSQAGVRRGNISAQTDLVGSGSLAIPPPFDTFLRGCGFVRTVVQRMAIGAVTGGPYQIDEGVTQGSVTAKVARVTYNGDPFLFLYDVAGGTFNTSDPIVGDTSSASATATLATTNGGYMYRPRSQSFETLTVQTLMADTASSNALRQKISGALGNPTFNMQAGDSCLITAEYAGQLQAAADDTILTGISQPTLNPPKFLAADFRVLDHTDVCVDAVRFSPGNDIQMRKCANEATGLKTANIAERNGDGSITPEGSLVAEHDYFNKMFNNETGAISTRLGTVDGNQFFLQAPGAQYRSISTGERGGNIVFNTDINLNEINDNNNDFIIIAS